MDLKFTINQGLDWIGETCACQHSYHGYANLGLCVAWQDTVVRMGRRPDDLVGFFVDQIKSDSATFGFYSRGSLARRAECLLLPQ